MSAEPPDSRGMGWAWKCLNMSDTVWNHRWWTWHCPFSFTDKRKCWEGGRRMEINNGDTVFKIQRIACCTRGYGKKTTTKDREIQCETHWMSETDRPGQRSGHFCEASRCGSKATECQGWHQRKRRQLTLPQHCWLAGCDVQGSCYIRAQKTLTLLHLFQGLNKLVCCELQWLHPKMSWEQAWVNKTLLQSRAAAVRRD